MRKFYCSKLSAHAVEDMFPIFQEHFPKAEPRALYQSVSLLVGDEINGATLAKFGWILAGNQHRLRGGMVVSEWISQPFDEWVPLQIIEAQQKRTKAGNHGATFTFLIFGGLSCSETVKRFWSTKFCRFLSSKIGFSKPWGKMPFKRIDEFVGIRLYGLVERRLSEKYPGFEKIDVTPPFLAANRSLVKKRNRRGFECPKNYRHPCYLCPIGYDRCPCGTHPRTYVKVDCADCKTTKWTDPRLVELEICLECFRKKAEKR